jgi:hypothetical protein
VVGGSTRSWAICLFVRLAQRELGLKGDLDAERDRQRRETRSGNGLLAFGRWLGSRGLKDHEI